MIPWQWHGLRLAALLGFTGSMASWVETSHPSLFCGFQGGCQAIASSALSNIFGIPLPLLGVVGFGTFFLLTLFPRGIGSRLLGLLAFFAGLAGAGLILVQLLELGQICRLCLVSDTAGLVLAFLFFLRPGAPPAPSPALRGAWLALALAAGLGPWTWSWLHPLPGAPPEVVRFWKADKINVVLVTDFDCVRCRQAHGNLREFLKEVGSQVHFVELIHPLPKNDHAAAAARAFFCAAQQEQGARMADALFQAEDLTAAGCRALAKQLTLDLDQFDRCFADTSRDQTIRNEHAWVRNSGARGLPALWIGNQLLEGVPSLEELRSAFQRVSAER